MTEKKQPAKRIQLVVVVLECKGSPEDVEVTERLVEACKILGIDVMGHIVLGSDKFLSLKEKEYM